MERKIVSDRSKIFIKNLNPFKRPISAVADNVEIRNAKSVKVKINHKKNLISYMIKIEVFKKNKNRATQKRNFIIFGNLMIKKF